MKCEHCKVDFNENQMIFVDINNQNKAFCCDGCLGVYALINQENLGEFYTKLKNNTLNPVKQTSINFNSFDKYISQDEDGFSCTSFIIENIHCEACVWLCEKILTNTDGILKINISQYTHKADIVFDQNTINIQTILQKILSIGYIPTPYNPTSSKKAQKTKRDLYIKLILAVACVMNVMWLSVAKYAGVFSGMDESIKDIINFAEFIFASAVLFYTGGEFFKSAFIAVKNKFINMDFLVIFGASLAYIYSIVAMFLRLENVYFDSVAMIICFVFTGKYMELISKKNTLDSIDKINELLDDSVSLKTQNGYINTPINEVKINDIIKLTTDDKVLIDGKIILGNATFNTSHITGETKPFKATINDKIISGYQLIDGYIEYQCTKTFQNSTLNQIIQTLQKTKKSKFETLINQISSYFGIVVFICFIICFCFWINKSSFETSLINAISVLIIACPCALALATPVCTLIAANIGFKNKILFKDTLSIEKLSRCDMVVFDKTGVLTSLRILSKQDIDEDTQNIIYSLCSKSSHIISKQITHSLNHTQNIALSDIKETKARGISATIQGGKYDKSIILGGSYQFMLENNIKNINPQENTHFYFAINGQAVALFEFENKINPQAKKLISYLKQKNIKTVILSGDTKQAVSICAKELGINSYHFQMLPQDKLHHIQNYAKKHKVAMVGDGVNDALALKQAHIGISIKGANFIAIDSSDIVFLDQNIYTLKKAIKLSKACLRKIKQNLAFSLTYNLIGVCLAFCGMVNPLLASVLMSLSSIIVVANAISLNKIKLN